MQQTMTEDFITLSPVRYQSQTEDNIFQGFKDRYKVDGTLIVLSYTTSEGVRDVSYVVCNSHTDHAEVQNGAKTWAFTSSEAVSELAKAGIYERPDVVTSWFKQLNSWLKSPAINPDDGTLLINPGTVGVLHFVVTNAVAKEVTDHIKENSAEVFGTKLKSTVLSGQDKNGVWGRLKRNNPEVQLLKLTVELFEDKELKLGSAPRKGPSWTSAIKQEACNFGLAVVPVVKAHMPKSILAITKIGDTELHKSVLIKVANNEVKFLGVHGLDKSRSYDRIYTTSLATIDLEGIDKYYERDGVIRITGMDPNKPGVPLKAMSSQDEINFWVNGTPGSVRGYRFFNAPNTNVPSPLTNGADKYISLDHPYTKEDSSKLNNFPKQAMMTWFIPLVSTSMKEYSKDNIISVANMVLEIARDALDLQDNSI